MEKNLQLEYINVYRKVWVKGPWSYKCKTLKDYGLIA